MNIHEIDIQTFSKTPFGRYRDDGDDSGEAFREDYLKGPLTDPTVDIVEVHLDSVKDGYEFSSSFLEEAFGGLVRVNKISADTINRKLKIVTKHQDYKEEIELYIRTAAE